MATLEEVKTLITEDRKNTELMRKEVDRLKGDALDKETFAKLEEIVTKGFEERQAKEVEYLAELKAAKDMAEEASLKAGRRGGAGGDELKEEDIAHKTAFIDFIRGKGAPGLEQAVNEAEKKAIGSATGSGAGVAVPAEIARDIQSKTHDDSVMESLVKTVEVGTSDYKEIIDKGGMGFGWVGRGDARAETGKPSVYEVEPTMGTIYAYPKEAEEALDDVFFNVENWLIDSARTAFSNGRDIGVIGGDSNKTLTGMLHAPPVADADGARADKVYQFLASGAAGDIGEADQLIKLVYLLKAQYRSNGRFLMNSLTTSKVRTLKDGNGRFLWSDSMTAGQPATLLGYGVSTVEAMPDVAANSTPIGFGDFRKAYTMVNRHGLRITKDEITEPGFVKWHIRQRLGGAPTNDDAVKFLKIAA